MIPVKQVVSLIWAWIMQMTEIELKDINVEEILDALENGINDGGKHNFSIESLEESLEIPKETLKSLILEDDWSFIIKCHTLIESSLNQSIVTMLGEKGLENIISKIDTSTPSVGKVTIAENIGLLDRHKANAIRVISEIRNLIIHNVKNINFTLIGYYNGLDKNQKKRIVGKLLNAGLGKDNQEQKEKFKQIISRHQEIAFKYLVYSHTLATISLLILSSKKVDEERKKKDEIFTSMASVINKLHEKYGNQDG